MRRHRAPTLAALLLLASGAMAYAQPVGDAVAGRDVAVKLCASCHAVNADGAGVTRADVPPLRAIAKDPATTPERLAAGIILPHPEMPGIALTRQELRDVIAYIMTLRDEP